MEDINSNEMCTDWTLWDILCEMSALLCDCLLAFFSYIGYIVRGVYRERRIMQCVRHSDSTENRIVTERLVMWECLCLFVCLFVCLLHCINSDKFVLSNENREIYQTSTQ